MWIASAFASAPTVSVISLTPVRKGLAAGAAWDFAGTASKSQLTQLADAGALTQWPDDLPKRMPELRLKSQVALGHP